MAGAWSVTVLATVVVLLSAVHAALKLHDRFVGWFNIDKNEKGFIQGLNFAMAEYNKKSNEQYGRKIISVTKAKKRVVAGTSYEALVVTGLTTCTKPIDNINNCTLQETHELQKSTRCTFQVHTNPGQSKFEVKKSFCKQ